MAALRYYEQTLPLLDKLGRPLDRASNEGNIAEVCAQAGQYADAFSHGRRVHAYAAAFRYQGRFMSLKDSLRGDETIRQTAALQYRFDLTKKQSQITLLTKTQEIEQKQSRYR